MVAIGSGAERPVLPAAESIAKLASKQRKRLGKPKS